MARNSTVEAAVASGAVRVASRVLTCSVPWPEGEPPWAAGTWLQMPAIPGTPPAYAAASFDPDTWTDCTRLVQEWHWTEDAQLQCGQLSLVVLDGWRAALAQCFEEMRAVVVQQRTLGGGADTGWVNLCWCVSDGFAESWRGGVHSWTVNAKDVLKLAGLEILGARTGSAVYQADLIQEGRYNAHQDLVLDATTSDAYEFGVPSIWWEEGGASVIQPNWSDKPGPSLWCTNARDADDAVVSTPVPLTIGGDAVQVVFGEGVVRVGLNWAHTTSDKGGVTDFSQGLGLHVGETPAIEGVVWRFAHPAMQNRNGDAVASDIYDDLEVTGANPGIITVGRNGIPILVLSYGQTLILRDGSGRRYATQANGNIESSVFPVDTSLTLPVGTPIQLGDANRVTDVLTRMLQDSGYQQADADAPFYLTPPAAPIIEGTAQNIILPPLVYRDTDEISRLEAVARLRQQGYLPANYYLYATSDGQVVARSVSQLADGDTAVLPIAALPADPGLSYDRTDIGVHTRVVARGVYRQVQDLTQLAGVTIAPVSYANGGLPDPNSYVYGGYGLNAWAYRTGDSHTGSSYLYDLSRLFARNQPGSDSLYDLASFGWYTRYMRADLGVIPTNSANDWANRLLLQVTLPEAREIDAVEVRADNTALTSIYRDYPYLGDRPRGPAMPQILTVEYFDLSLGVWLPLVSNWLMPIQPVLAERKQSSDFDSRAAVTTDRLRIRCMQAGYVQSYTGSGDVNFFLGVWLSQLKIWGSAEIRGVAELGNADNYGGEMSSDEWQAVLQRMRSRTYVLPDAVSWVQTQSAADWLALQWLKEFAKDLAPRKFAAVRPDLRLWDTVHFTNPRGEEGTYLVTGIDARGASGNASGAQGVVTVTGVNYLAPYYE